MLSVVFGTSDRGIHKEGGIPKRPSYSPLWRSMGSEKGRQEKQREPKYCSSVLMQHYRHWMENIIAVLQLTVIKCVIQGLQEKVRFLTFEKDQGLIEDKKKKKVTSVLQGKKNEQSSWEEVKLIQTSSEISRHFGEDSKVLRCHVIH